MTGGARTRAGGATKRATSERVLVCDDDARVRDSVVEALESGAFEVDTAERAVDAIQKVMRNRYQALVLDLKLPGLGGLDAISILRRLDEHLPVIVMTGHASYEVEQAARSAGIFYYLVKPFPISELLDAVTAAVRSRTGRAAP